MHVGDETEHMRAVRDVHDCYLVPAALSVAVCLLNYNIYPKFSKIWLCCCCMAHCQGIFSCYVCKNYGFLSPPSTHPTPSMYLPLLTVSPFFYFEPFLIIAASYLIECFGKKHTNTPGYTCN